MDAAQVRSEQWEEAGESVASQSGGDRARLGIGSQCVKTGHLSPVASFVAMSHTQQTTNSAPDPRGK